MKTIFINHFTKSKNYFYSVVFYLLTIPFSSLGQRWDGRVYPDYKGPIPSFGDAMKYTFFGTILFLIAIFIFKNSKDEDGFSVSQGFGCLLLIGSLLLIGPLILLFDHYRPIIIVVFLVVIFISKFFD
jgi:hypothetical protein